MVRNLRCKRKAGSVSPQDTCLEQMLLEEPETEGGKGVVREDRGVERERETKRQTERERDRRQMEGEGKVI